MGRLTAALTVEVTIVDLKSFSRRAISGGHYEGVARNKKKPPKKAAKLRRTTRFFIS